ncbi:MAG TPA: hypothetical protein VIK28_04970 [Sedimentisphaerales bacterium]|jgi:hypothetical protein
MELNERAWAKSLAARLGGDLSGYGKNESTIAVTDGKKLPYKCEIYEYSGDDKQVPDVSKYETDLLVSDKWSDGRWVPRVVVECKLAITTHDTLTYSAKAATHKHVHPYLRYGILVGDLKNQALPGRLVKHGAYFDFMLSWKEQDPSSEEWQHLCDLLRQEVDASRELQEMFTTNRSSQRKRYQSLHRKLVLK